MQYAYTYVLIPWITILGHSDHKTGIMIKFALKFDAICMYICPDSRNYHIRLLQSQNRYHDWIPTEISYTTPNELTREYPQSNTQVCMNSMDILQSSIFNTTLIGHPPDFNANSIMIPILCLEWPIMVIAEIRTYLYAYCIKFQCAFNCCTCFVIRVT